MTMNYCGRCGSANGGTARFCRQCGADLSSQAAVSSSSTPFDVGFSTESANKDPERESSPSPGTRPFEVEPGDRTPDFSASGEGGDQDPKAISESLRRIRVSGPLILAAIKQSNDRQSIDRINEIIAQSIQGETENRAPVESEGAPPPPAPPPVHQVREREANKAAYGEAGLQPARQISAGQGVAKHGAIIRSTARGGAQSVARRATRWFSRSNANRSIPQAPPNTGHSGPSTVLMQASGFKPRSSIGPKVILGIILLAVLLAAPIYFMFRDRLLTQAQPVDGDLNLISSADHSAQLVKAGESERAQGKYSAAIDHFHRALDLAPNNLDIRFLLAQTYLEDGRIDDGARSCREILRIAPEYLDARLQLAEIHRARGNWTAAYKEYQNIIELNQSSPQAAAALAAIESQQAVAQMEERAKNAQLRRRGSRLIIPSLPAVILRSQVPLAPLGLSEIGRVNPPAALGGLGIDEKPDPRSVAESHKRMGVRYLNIREFRAAIKEFLQALDLTSDDKDLYYFIGSSYHGLGLEAEAYKFYSHVDAGPYVGPAQSGAKQTRKAAQEANKQRNDPKFQSMKNEVEDNRTSKPKSVMNRILESLR